MASGCILGDCSVCGDIIWEDEVALAGDDLIHEHCKPDWYIKRYHLSEDQFRRLYGASELRRDIADLKKDLAGMVAIYQQHIAALENDLAELEKAKVGT